MEEWKDINNYEGYYQISNLGNIRSLDRLVSNKHGKRLAVGKPKSIYKSKAGYWIVTLIKEQITKTFLVHRLVAEHFISNPDNKLEVNHIDGNKSNAKYNNLEWCTRSENQIHAHKTGLMKSGYKPNFGKDNINCTLSEELVLEIRTKYATGKYSQRILAKEYKVSQVTICSILNNKTWVI
jgi:hypothetical protein